MGGGGGGVSKGAAGQCTLLQGTVEPPVPQEVRGRR